jgi:Mn-dependent DtxR family transcriptional regulator
VKVWDARREVERLFDDLGIGSPEARANLDVLAHRLDEVPDRDLVESLKDLEREP